jgi:hypothetical protein
VPVSRIVTENEIISLSGAAVAALRAAISKTEAGTI